MKAMTMRLTVMCEYCNTPLTYRKIENKEKGNLHGHYHGECRKLKNMGIKFSDLQK